MMTRAEFLARRRRQLVTQSAALRTELALQAAHLNHTLVSAEAGLRVLNRVRKHPGWIAAAGFALALIRPRRLSSLLRSGSVGLRAWRNTMPVLQHIIGRRN